MGFCLGAAALLLLPALLALAPNSEWRWILTPERGADSDRAEDDENDEDADIDAEEKEEVDAVTEDDDEGASLAAAAEAARLDAVAGRTVVDDDDEDDDDDDDEDDDDGSDARCGVRADAGPDACTLLLPAIVLLLVLPAAAEEAEGRDMRPPLCDRSVSAAPTADGARCLAVEPRLWRPVEAEEDEEVAPLPLPPASKCLKAAAASSLKSPPPSAAEWSAELAL
jgi:hypothetical protein